MTLNGSHVVGPGKHASPGKGGSKDKGRGMGRGRRDEKVHAALARSPYEHVMLDAAGLGVGEGEVRGMFSGFDVDQVSAGRVYF